MTESSRIDRDNPWPGLLSFEEADHEFFRGRSAEKAAALRLVRRERVTVLFGRSGLGKSSLLKAGLAPVLRGEDYFPVYIRLDYSDSAPPLAEQIFTRLRDEASRWHIQLSGFPAPTLWELFHRPDVGFWNAQNRPVTPVLIFDQFEELFTKGTARAADAAAMVQQLADIATGTVPDSVRQRLEAAESPESFDLGRNRHRVVISLREDFLHHFDRLRPRIRAALDARLPLGPMNAAAAMEVLSTGSHLLADGAARAITRFVAGASADDAEVVIEPALLSVVCHELNNRRRIAGAERITEDLLGGEKSKILMDFYERSVDDLGPAPRRFIEESLLTDDGYRDSIAERRVLDTPGMSPEVVETLIRRRLVRMTPAGNINRLELTHDLLIDVVKKSRDQRREREAAEREESRERQLWRTRRLLIGVAALAVVFLLMAAAALWAYLDARKSRIAAQEAEQKAITARIVAVKAEGRANASSIKAIDALKVATDEKRLATLAEVDLSEAAIARDNTGDALAHLAQVLRHDPENDLARKMVFRQLTRPWGMPVRTLRKYPSAEILSGEQTPDGRRLLVVTNHSAIVLDTASGHIVCERPYQNLSAADSSRAVLSADGRRLALAQTRSNVQIWNVDRCSPSPIASFSPSTQFFLALSPDGSLLAGPSGKDALSVWRTDTSAEPVTVAMTQLPYRFAFSPRGTYLAVVLDPWSVHHDVWILRTAELSKPAPARAFRFDGDVHALQFDPDEATLMIADSSSAYVWDIAREHGEEIVPGRKGSLQSASIGRHAKVLTSTADRIALWSIDGTQEWSEASPAGGFAKAAFAGSGPVAHVVAWTKNGTVTSWTPIDDSDAAAVMDRALTNDSDLVGAFFEPGAQSFLAVSATEISAWRVHRPVAETTEMPDNNSLTPDGNRWVSGESGLIRFTDVSTGVKTQLRLNTHGLSCEKSTEFAFSPDGSMIGCYTGGIPNYMVLTSGGSLLFRVFAERADLDWSTMTITEASPRFSPDSTSLLVWRSKGGRQAPVLVDVKTRQERALPEARSAAFDHSGKRVATAGEDGWVTVWDVTASPPRAIKKTRTRPSTGPFRFDPALTVQFDPAPPYDRVVYCSGNTATVWNLADGGKVELAHRDKVIHVEFSPDGQFLLTASKDHTARIWRADGVPVTLPLVHDAPLVTALFSPDGSAAVTATMAELSENAAGLLVRVWDARYGHPLTEPTTGLLPQFLERGKRVVMYGPQLGAVYLDLARTGTAAEAPLLADLAEWIGGRTVNSQGTIVDLPGRAARGAALARAAKGSGGDTARVVRWYMTDSLKRTVTPFARLSVSEFLRRRLTSNESSSAELLTDAASLFPRHPEVVRWLSRSYP